MNYNQLHPMLALLITLYHEYQRVHHNQWVPSPMPADNRELDLLCFHSWVEDKSFNKMPDLLAALPEQYQPEIAQLDLFDDTRKCLLTLLNYVFPRKDSYYQKMAYTLRHHYVMSSDAVQAVFSHNGAGFAGKTFTDWLDDNQPLEERLAALLQAYQGITRDGGR